MTHRPVPLDGLAVHLGRFLGVGTWIACAIIAVGLACKVFGVPAPSTPDHVVLVGIVLLIALPPLRVVLMGLWFLLRREVDFAIFAAAVLLIILVSTVLAVGSI